MQKLNYKIMTKVNYGTEEEPNIVEHFQSKEVFATKADYDAQMAFAKAEAYNGEVTVEELPDPETEPTTDEILKTILGVN